MEPYARPTEKKIGWRVYGQGTVVIYRRGQPRVYKAGESFTDLQAARTPAHLRLIFEELFFVELGLEFKRRQMKAQTGVAFTLNDRAREATAGA